MFQFQLLERLSLRENKIKDLPAVIGRNDLFGGHSVANVNRIKFHVTLYNTYMCTFRELDIGLLGWDDCQLFKQFISFTSYTTTFTPPSPPPKKKVEYFPSIFFSCSNSWAVNDLFLVWGEKTQKDTIQLHSSLTPVL